MFKVQSLKSTVIFQFAVILIPLVGLLTFQSVRDAHRSAALNELFRWHEQAGEARERHRVFLNGAADAVDTGRLSAPALQALNDAAASLALLGAQTRAADVIDAAQSMARLAATLAAERDLPALQRHAPAINEQRLVVEGVDARHDRELNVAIARSIDEAQRDSWIVGAMSLLLLGVTVGFVIRMIRHLSSPLNLAVSVANRIADGQSVDRADFEGQRDIGNLLRSLEAMNGHLQRYRAEVETARRTLEDKVQQLSESQSSLAEAQQLAGLGSWHWEPGRTQIELSDQMYRLLGTKPEQFEPTLHNFTSLLAPQEQQLLRDRLDALLSGPGVYSDELRLRCLDGEVRTVFHQMSSRATADGRIERLCGVVQDITARRHAEEEIRRLAHHDSLTGLPNRRFFNELLAHSVARARRGNEMLATLFLDLDRFKRINDTLGHAAGDALLKEVARRLTRCVRDSDHLAREADAAGDGVRDDDAASSAVARLAGDEFTVALVEIKRPQDAAIVARRILAELTKPFALGDNEVVVTGSVGIAIYPTDGDTAETLLKNADAAMYRAKELGKNTYQFFAEDMNSTAFAKLNLEGDLRKAIEREQFVLYYQPKVEARSGAVAGVEALIRWRHPVTGLMTPGEFIPLAEEAGLIGAIGDWVLEAACLQLRRWREAGLPQVSIAINLAAPSFQHKDLVAQVRSAIERHAVAPGALLLEATESMMMSNVERTLSTLNQLRKIGVGFSIDDFGTGYSSLSYLRRFPIDQLKIDCSFVAEMTDNADDAAIVTAIVSLGRSLGLEVVAEGVETAKQARILREIGCHVLQGYYFSRPVPADEMAALLRQGARWADSHPSTSASSLVVAPGLA